MQLGRLHVLTDFHFQQQHAHHQLAKFAIEGGADVIQFRQKDGAMRHKFHEAQLTAEVCNAHQTPLLIDDHIDIALGLKAAGVHLGKADYPILEARQVLGNGYIIGATANSIKDIGLIKDLPIDYIGFGPIYQSSSKSNPASLQGLERLYEVCKTITLPVIAIAGITVDRVKEVLDAGAYGVAVMTAISTADDPKAATERFRNEIDRLV